MVSSPTAVLGGLATIAENPEVVMSFSRMDAGSVVPAASSFDLSLPDHRFLLVLKTRLSRFDCDEKGLFVRDRFPYVPSLVQSFLILETRQIHTNPSNRKEIETIDYYRCFSFCTLFALLCYMFAPQAPFD